MMSLFIPTTERIQNVFSINQKVYFGCCIVTDSYNCNFSGRHIFSWGEVDAKKTEHSILDPIRVFFWNFLLRQEKSLNWVLFEQK